MWSLHDQLPFRLQRALRTLVHLVRAWKLLPFNLQLAVGLLGLFTSSSCASRSVLKLHLTSCCFKMSQARAPTWPSPISQSAHGS